VPETHSELNIKRDPEAPRQKTFQEKREYVIEVVKVCANVLLKGETCGLKRVGEKDYVKRTVFCDPTLKRLCWVKDTEDRKKLKMEKNSLELAEILGCAEGPPAKFKSLDSKKPHFKTCTFTINTQRTKDGVDLFFKTEALKGGWLHAIKVILSGGSCVGDESIRVDPAIALSSAPVPAIHSPSKNEGSIGYAAQNTSNSKVTYEYVDGISGNQKEGFTVDSRAVSSSQNNSPQVSVQKTAGRASSAYQAIPEELANDIRQFGIKGYANKFFQVSKHAKKGLFGAGKISVEKLLQFSNKPLTASLLSTIGNDLQSEAVKIFQQILEYCGDAPKAAKAHKDAMSHNGLSEIVSHGLYNEKLQDEIVCQLVKQTSQNPSASSCERAWELLTACVDAFRPSALLSAIVFEHCWANCEKRDAIGAMALYLQALLPISRGQVRKEGTGSPTGQIMYEDTLQLIKAKCLPVSIYKSTLEGVLTLERFVRRKAELETGQHQEDPEDPDVPLFVQLLTKAVLQLGGEKTEGIFRRAGDSSSLSYYHKKVGQCNYDVLIRVGAKGCVRDPIEAADLLKDFFRKLAEPLFPPDLYNECIEAGKKVNDGSRAVRVAHRLSETNLKTLVYILRFLRQLAGHEAVTKMGQSNLALVFAPNFVRNPQADVMSMARDSDYANRFLEHLIASDDPAIS